MTPTNPTPRDPLLNVTLSVPKEKQQVSNLAAQYRLTRLQNGEYILQGAYLAYNEQDMPYHEWRDIPTVFL